MDCTDKAEADALAALFSPAPCAGCPFWHRCAIERRACATFRVYVGKKRDWRTVARTDPTREIYLQVFAADSDSLPHRSGRRLAASQQGETYRIGHRLVLI